MQGYIHVYIKDKHIEVMGQEFLLGELSLSLMNISQEQINKIRPLHSKIEQLAGIDRFEHLFYRHILHTDKQRKLELAADRLIKLPTFSEWTEIHNAVCDMVDMLREIKIFEVLLNPIDKSYIEQYSSGDYFLEVISAYGLMLFIGSDCRLNIWIEDIECCKIYFEMV